MYLHRSISSNRLLVTLLLALTAGAEAASFRAVPNTDPNRLPTDPYTYLVSTKPIYQNVELYKSADDNPGQTLFVISKITKFNTDIIEANCELGAYSINTATRNRILEIQKYKAKSIKRGDAEFDFIFKAIQGKNGALHQAEGIGSLCMFGDNSVKKRWTVQIGAFIYDKNYPFKIIIGDIKASTVQIK